MISVTRLNGDRFVLNADLIRTIEENPDTVITLVNGDHIVVRERMSEIVRMTIEYGRLLRRAIPLAPADPNPGDPGGGAPAPAQGRAPAGTRGS